MGSSYDREVSNGMKDLGKQIKGVSWAQSLIILLLLTLIILHLI